MILTSSHQIHRNWYILLIQGYNSTIAPFPKYAPDPIKELVRKPVETDKKEIFKYLILFRLN